MNILACGLGVSTKAYYLQSSSDATPSSDLRPVAWSSPFCAVGLLLGLAADSIS